MSADASAYADYLADRREADRYSFTELLQSSREELLFALAETHTALANLHADIAYLRANEKVLPADNRQLRVMEEGDRDALIEKKFLIIRLLDQAST